MMFRPDRGDARIAVEGCMEANKQLLFDKAAVILQSACCQFHCVKTQTWTETHCSQCAHSVLKSYSATSIWTGANQ